MNGKEKTTLKRVLGVRDTILKNLRKIKKNEP